MKFRSQRTSDMEPSATSTTVTGPVGERLQTGTEDAPVLDRPASLRRLHDSGAAYKYPPDLLWFLNSHSYSLELLVSTPVEITVKHGYMAFYDL